MTPNERRALANALTHHLRRGWLTHRSTSTYASNPAGWHYASSRGFPATEYNRSTERIESVQYVRGLIDRDPSLGTRDALFELLRPDYDAAIARLPPARQAEWEEFLCGFAHPFYRDGDRLRWRADRCPIGAKHTVLVVTLACAVEYPDPRDVDAEYAADDELDLAELQRVLARADDTA